MSTPPTLHSPFGALRAPLGRLAQLQLCNEALADAAPQDALAAHALRQPGQA